MKITVSYVPNGLSVDCPKCGAKSGEACIFHNRFNKNKLGLILHSERAVAAVEFVKNTQVKSNTVGVNEMLNTSEKTHKTALRLSVACPACGAGVGQLCDFQDASIFKVHTDRYVLTEEKGVEHTLNVDESTMAEFDFFSQLLLEKFETKLSFDRRLDLFKRLKKYQDQTGEYQLDPTHYQFIQAVRFFSPELLKEK